MAKRVKETVQFEDGWFYNRTLKEAITTLCEYANKYGDDAIMHSESWGHDGPDEHFVTFERDETDEERTIRLELARKERERKALAKLSIEEKEKQELARLQKKYG